MYLILFFFKQKTAYEVRISDWSSDVCSSDLVLQVHQFLDHGEDVLAAQRRHRILGIQAQAHVQLDAADRRQVIAFAIKEQAAEQRFRRSEEHTSELRSLMRISYAVFCLKKKKKYPVDK